MRGSDDPSMMWLLIGIGALIGGFVTSWVMSSGRLEPLSQDEQRYVSIRVRDRAAFPGRLYFGPYACTDSCEGHYAGFQWAQENQPKAADDCGGSGSSSFLEGCMTYLQIIGRQDEAGAY